MKQFLKPFVFAACLAVASGLPLRAADPTSAQVDFGRFDPPASGAQFVEVNLNSNLISMAAKFAEQADPAIADILRGIQLVRVNVIGVDEKNQPELKGRMDKIRSELGGQGWERVVTAQQQDQDVGVYLKLRGGDAIEGLVVTVFQSGKEAVFVNIVGDLRPEQITAVGERLGIEPLKKAGEAIKKP